MSDAAIMEDIPRDFPSVSRRLMLSQYDGWHSECLKAQAVEAVAASFPKDDFSGETRRTGPLRVGFVSSDLCDHPVGLLLLPLLLFLNRNRITPILYSTGGREDQTRAMLRRYSQWHEASTLNDAALTDKLRADQLHIAVDLAGHTANNRLPVFARRVAPLQISWLGYFATTGVPAMDAVLMDGGHVPPGCDFEFTEEVLRLPHVRWCYNPVAFAPPVSPPPCIHCGVVTFGSFNNPLKYNVDVFAIWGRILHAMPESRLVLKWSAFANEAEAKRVRDLLGSLGIASDRIELRGASFHRDMLEQYADIDVALDPFPFTGGYTTCEAMWMGLPVVTLIGDRAVSRQTYAVLSVLNQQNWSREWAADNVEGYVESAIRLASDPGQLSLIRQSTRSAMKSSPLMNGRQFARDFEDLLVARWQRNRPAED